MLVVGLAITGLAVWILRLPSSLTLLWPWLLLLTGMFVAADTLTTAYPASLTRKILPPGDRPISAPRRRRAIVLLYSAAALLAAWIVLRLWPNYRDWEGTLLPWVLALAFVLIASLLMGKSGGGSPGLASAARARPGSRQSLILEALAVVLILAVAVFLRTYRFDSIPPAITNDETDAGLGALSILQGERRIALGPPGTTFLRPLSISWHSFSRWQVRIGWA